MAVGAGLSPSPRSAESDGRMHTVHTQCEIGNPDMHVFPRCATVLSVTVINGGHLTTPVDCNFFLSSFVRGPHTPTLHTRVDAHTGMALLVLACAPSLAFSPPLSVRRCLNNSWIFAAGPSELAGILGWLTGGETISTRRNTKHARDAERNQSVDARRSPSMLRCSTRRNLGDRHWECVSRDYRRRSACREDLYADKPFDANCTGAPRSSWGDTRFRITYMWKSYQFSRADRIMANTVRWAAERRAAAPATHPRVIAVLSTGLAQFSRFRNHKEALLHRVHDDHLWPQAYIDDFVNETSHLFELFVPSGGAAPADPRDAASCVAFRAQNVAARHGNLSEPRHHPSAANGIHHWFNRMSIALARARGLAVVDYTNVTISTAPLDHPADGRGSVAVRRADALEGDVYHGYSSRLLGPHFLQRLADACCWPPAP